MAQTTTATTKQAKADDTAAADTVETLPDGLPVTELPSSDPELTVERAFGHRKDAIVSAFIHTEKLRKPTRKLTASAWKEEFAAFVAAPR